MTKREALVVADDLTGAMDTGHAFAVRGFETVVRHDPSFDPETQVLVVDTDSRYADADVARERVHEVVSSVDAALVYKKIDSTLRGNVSTEIVAAAEAMGADVAAIAPAFPSNERITADGYHLVRGRPVADTEPGNDSGSPVDDSHLPQLLRKNVDEEVVHVSVYPVASDAISPYLCPSKAAPRDQLRLLVFDALHDVHLDAIAAGAAAVEGEILLVGSGGLAEYAHVPGEPEAKRESSTDTPVGRAFGIAGSADSTTRNQLEYLDERRVVELDTVRAVREPRIAAQEAADVCLDRFENRDDVVLASALDDDTVETTLTAARREGIAERDARNRVEEALAATADRVWTEVAIDGIFLTGGAVAKAVLDQLVAGGIALCGEEVAPGVPVGVIRGGRADGVPIVTKAGAFGSTTTIADALDVLRRGQRGNG